MHQKMELCKQKNNSNYYGKETIHSGHFMISDFEAEAQDDGDEVAVAVPVLSTHDENFQSTSMLKNPYCPITKCGKKSRSRLNIETSLTDLFQCMSLAYRQKLTSPKWNRFKGIRLRWKEKIRLNNVIWRCWHMQFITKKNFLVCQFASPLDVDTHNKPEAVVLEGKYWKRKLNAVTAEYKKWRMYFRNHALGAPRDGQDVVTDTSEWKPHSFENGMMVDEDYMEFMSDTLFSSLSTNQPFAFPDTREIARTTNLADFIQPSLVQLQPNLDDFMDTLEPIPDLFYSKLPPVPEECATNGTTDDSYKVENSYHVTSSASNPQQLNQTSDHLVTNNYSALKSNERVSSMTEQQLRAYQYSQQSQQPNQFAYSTFQNQYQSQQQDQYQQIQLQQQLPHHTQHQQASVQQQQQHHHQIQHTHHQQSIQPVSGSSTGVQNYQVTNPSQVQTFQLPNMSSQTYQASSLPTGSSLTANDFSSMEYVDIHQLAYNNQASNSADYANSSEFKVPSSLSPAYNLHHNQRTTLRSNSLPLMNSSSGLPASEDPVSIPGNKLKHRTRSRNSGSSIASSRRTSVSVQPSSNEANSTSALLTQLLTSSAGSGQSSFSPCLTTQSSNSSSKSTFMNFGFDSQIPFAYPPSHLPPVKRSRTPDHVLTSYTDQYVYKTTSPPISNKSRSVLLSSQSESSLYNLSNKNTESQRLYNIFGISSSARSSGQQKPLTGRRFSCNDNPYSRREKSQTLFNSRLNNSGDSSKSHSFMHGTSHQSGNMNSMSTGVLGSASNSPKYPDSPGTSESLSLSPLNVGSPSRAPVSPPSNIIKPPNSASPYKEHRRLCHTNAEQKRRCNIKNGFDTLHSLIPHMNHSSNSKMSKAAMLQKGAEYIRQLRAERSQIEEDMENLRQQVESLNSAISNCQSLLPATGAPISRHRATKMKEMFDDYVRRRTQEDWKFWLLSLICEPLLTSFNSMVSTASVDELCRTTLQWIEQHCSLVHLRPIVPDALRSLCTSTDALSEPSRLPEQARAAANKRTKS